MVNQNIDILMTLKAKNEAQAAVSQVKSQYQQLGSTMQKVANDNKFAATSAANLSAEQQKLLAVSRSLADGLKQLGQNQSGFTALKEGATSFGQSLGGLTGLVSTLVGVLATVGIGASFAAAISQAREYEQALTKLQTTAGATAEDIAKVKDSIKGLATQQEDNTLVDGFTQAKKAGLDTAQALDVMRASAGLADAQFGSVADAADIASKSVANFGSQGITAEKAADLLAATIQNSNLELDDFTGQFQKLLPAATAAGASLKDVFAASAAFSRTGEPARQVTLTLNLALAALGKNSKQAQDALKGTGKTMQTISDDIKTKGLVPTLIELNDLFTDAKGNSVEGLSKLFGNPQIATAVANLAAHREAATAAANQVNNAPAGLAQNLADQANATGFGQFNEAIVTLKQNLQDLGVQLLPIVTAAMVALADAVKFITTNFDDLVTTAETVIAVLGVAGVAYAVINLSAVLGALSSALLVARTAALALYAVLAANPIVLIIAAITALVVVLIEATGGFDNFRKNAELCFAAFKGVVEDAIDYTGKFLKLAKDVATLDFTQFAKDWDEQVTDHVKDGVVAVLKAQKQAANAKLFEGVKGQLPSPEKVLGALGQAPNTDLPQYTIAGGGNYKAQPTGPAKLDYAQVIAQLKEAQALSADEYKQVQAIYATTKDQAEAEKQVAILKAENALYEQKIQALKTAGVTLNTTQLKGLRDQVNALVLSQQAEANFVTEQKKAADNQKKLNDDMQQFGESIATQLRQLGETNDQRQKENQLLQLRKQLIKDGLTDEKQLSSAISAASQSLDQLTKLQQEYNAALENQKTGLESFANQAKSNADLVKQSYADAFKGAEDALDNFVDTGKLSFADLAKSILAQNIKSNIHELFNRTAAAITPETPEQAAAAQATGATRNTGFFNILQNGAYTTPTTTRTPEQIRAAAQDLSSKLSLAFKDGGTDVAQKIRDALASFNGGQSGSNPLSGIAPNLTGIAGGSANDNDPLGLVNITPSINGTFSNGSTPLAGGPEFLQGLTQVFQDQQGSGGFLGGLSNLLGGLLGGGGGGGGGLLGGLLGGGGGGGLLGGLLGGGGGGGLLGGLFGGGAAAGGGLSSLFSSALSIFALAKGGVMTGSGPMPLRAYKSGGVASSPQMAIFGEGDQNEAFVPLPDGRRIPVHLNGQQSQPQVTNIHFNVNTPNADSFRAAQGNIQARAARQLQRAGKRNN